MSISTFMFKSIDILYNHSQNKRKICIDKNNKVNVIKDVIYDQSNPSNCKMDIYQLKNSKLISPVIIEIHGGGFVAGDKKYRKGLSNWLVRMTNATVFNINYSLAPKNKFPCAIYDIANAFNFIVKNANKWNVDKSKIIICGDSAGAFYASVLCTIFCNQKYRNLLKIKILKSNIIGCILNCGVYDLKLALTNKTLFNISKFLVKDFLGISVKHIENHPYYKIMSPINFINSNFPTTFVTYCKYDYFCKGQGELLVDTFEKNNVVYEEFYSNKKKENHTFSLTWNSKLAKQNNKKMIYFINRLINK